MLADRLNKDNKFDEMLGRTLRSSSQVVPADFTQNLIKRLRQAEEQKILARVVLQERFALAGCIVVGAAAIIAMAVFPETITAVFNNIVEGLDRRGDALFDGMPNIIETVRAKWEIYSVLAAITGFAIYSLIDLLAGDRLKTT